MSIKRTIFVTSGSPTSPEVGDYKLDPISGEMSILRTAWQPLEDNIDTLQRITKPLVHEMRTEGGDKVLLDRARPGDLMMDLEHRWFICARTWESMGVLSGKGAKA